MARLGFIIEGLILSFLAVNFSAYPAAKAGQLELPFGWLAQWMWIVIPVAFIGVSFPAMQHKMGKHQHWVHLIAIPCFFLPGLIYSRQIQEIPLRAPPSMEAWDALNDEYNERILFVGTSDGIRAIIPKSFDRDEVAQMIFSLDPSADPSRPEQAGGHQLPNRSESTRR